MTNTSMNKRVAVVTGAAAGIGRAVCLELLAHDFDVVGIDINTGAEEKGLRYIQADVGNLEQSKAALASILNESGRVDALVNNAGIVRDTPAQGIDLDEWNLILNINLTAVFLWTRLVQEPMKSAGYGRIVNMSSHAASRGTLWRAPYSASKAGVEGLTRTSAMELAAHGITVNAIAPGVIETERNRDSHTPARRNAWLKAVPMKRYGKTEDLTPLVAFLCGDGAAYITGQTFTVDGGFLMAGLDPA
ncbi:SDR family NAD(P)-dependent oxidoreductase [Pollutimonas sp. M17]|uniref:SDR family NAD(P)-dependent oxidoreductase n=1 Tax=Pollutimonas sp. M17 TaxID=2962065 RepID=UPI0021F3F0F0|nr:SDR family NAD(P)-dependent oxidoreductase [Pollutimonas sp. M17]UYO93599.1 SDR family oxidoreductase [Pollutimonas sp. M17]